MRIKFRALEPSDADLLYAVENDQSAWDSSDTVAPYSRHQLLDYAMNYNADPFSAGQLRLIAEAATAGNSELQPIGILDFYDISRLHSRAFTAIYVLPEFRGRGYAKAVLNAASDFTRKHLNLGKLAAKVLASNPVSKRIYGAAGYKETAVIPAWHFAGGRFHDVHLYILDLLHRNAE